jgi:hypothetical protein
VHKVAQRGQLVRSFRKDAHLVAHACSRAQRRKDNRLGVRTSSSDQIRSDREQSVVLVRPSFFTRRPHSTASGNATLRLKVHLLSTQ